VWLGVSKEGPYEFATVLSLLWLFVVLVGAVGQVHVGYSVSQVVVVMKCSGGTARAFVGRTRV